MGRALVMWCVAVVLAVSIAGCVAVVRTPPPPPRVEVRPTAPHAEAVWIDGHWQHRGGNYEWIPGHWESRPWGGAAWVAGHWVEARGGWRWVPGHWR